MCNDMGMGMQILAKWGTYDEIKKDVKYNINVIHSSFQTCRISKSH